jgi:ribosomal protein S18 acetylase RimI-like enzyme
MASLCIRRVLQPDASLWEAIQPIYMTSFPYNERVAFHFLEQMVIQGWSTLFISMEQDALTGFAMTSPLAHPGLHFLSYLAVDPNTRSQGTGSRLFRFILDDLQHGNNVTELIWEVDSDRPDPLSIQPKEREIRHRRIAFYQRNGAVLLDSVRDYKMPSMTGDEEIPVLLMWAASQPEVSPPAGERLRSYVKDIYNTIYGRGEDDQSVRRILESITL